MSYLISILKKYTLKKMKMTINVRSSITICISIFLWNSTEFQSDQFQSDPIPQVKFWVNYSKFVTEPGFKAGRALWFQNIGRIDTDIETKNDANSSGPKLEIITRKF